MLCVLCAEFDRDLELHVAPVWRSLRAERADALLSQPAGLSGGAVAPAAKWRPVLAALVGVLQRAQAEAEHLAQGNERARERAAALEAQVGGWGGGPADRVGQEWDHSPVWCWLEALKSGIHDEMCVRTLSVQVASPPHPALTISYASVRLAPPGVPQQRACHQPGRAPGRQGAAAGRGGRGAQGSGGGGGRGGGGWGRGGAGRAYACV